MAKPASRMSQTLSIAYAALNAGAFSDAEQLCRQIVDAEPDCFDAIHLLAFVQAQLEKQDEALASYDRALAVRPDHAEGFANRGIVIHELKRLEEALASYDHALKLKPKYVEAY
jgi:Tfp pilus assembly protein PilF